MRRSAHRLALVCLPVVACADSPARATLGSPHHPLTAYMLVRAADCDSHLRTLDEVHRTQWHGAIAIGGVFLVGAAADSTIVRRAARSYDLDVEIIVRDTPRFDALRDALRTHAVPGAPSLVVFDADGQVVMAAPSPTTQSAALALRQSIADALQRATHARHDTTSTR